MVETVDFKGKRHSEVLLVLGVKEDVKRVEGG